MESHSLACQPRSRGRDVCVFYAQLQYATAQDVQCSLQIALRVGERERRSASIAWLLPLPLCRESANCMRRAHRLRVLIILYMVASICLQSHISTYYTGSSIRCAVRPSSPHRTMHASDLIGIARVVRLLLLFLFSSSRCCSAFCQRLIARMMTVTIRLSVYLDTSNQAFVRTAIQMPRCACVCNVNCN